MKTNMQGTSIDAYRQLPATQMKTQGDRIYHVVASCRMPDMSLREIAADYTRMFGIDIDISTVSARVNALVACQRLQRMERTRPCLLSGKSVHPVRVQKGQGELWALRIPVLKEA